MKNISLNFAAMTILVLGACLTFPGASYGQSLRPSFSVRSYLGKCLDYGPDPQPGSPVYVADCGETTEQQIQIVEVDNRHRVLLYVGSLVVGVKDPQPIVGPEGGVGGTVSAPLFTLELQRKANPFSAIPPKQVFVLDGDSIILASDRSMVVQVQNSHAVNGTPLILAPRELKDAEFWTFSSGYYSSAQPTTGFVHVAQDPSGAPDAFINAVNNATDGTVIVVDQDVDITLDGTLPLAIPDGVTIRGDRRGVNLGPRIRISPDVTANGTMFDAVGRYTRFTGLRLQGPSRSTATEPLWIGILAHESAPCIIDHNDISNWTNAAIEPSNAGGSVPQAQPPSNRPQTIVVARNFIHHNERHDWGYGVAASDGSFPLVEGNTFIMNRHAITGDTSEHVGYRARYNLVQSAAPEYTKDWGLKHEHDQDFDMHGSGSGNSDSPLSPCYGVSHCGGIAGEYVEITGNTFLGTNRLNFFLRGTPSYLAVFADNTVEEPLLFAIKNAGASDKLQITNNRFGSANPTKKLGVGDFDGDGAQDLFLATGAAWYYAPAGAAEWRFLSAKTDKIDSLLLGDLDGDGRTDVIGKYGTELMVSWGGVSEWQPLFSSSAEISQVAIGDFDGDGRADIFYANGQNWFVSPGGATSFNVVQTSSFQVKDLRFGDIDGDGKTDVFGIEGGSWHVSYGAVSGWTQLPVSLTGSLNGLVLADFDGDGRADVAKSSLVFGFGWQWAFSRDATANWTYRTPVTSPDWSAPIASAAGIGFFDAAPGADVLLWGSSLGSNHISIVSGGSLSGPALRSAQSRQDMR